MPEMTTEAITTALAGLAEPAPAGLRARVELELGLGAATDHYVVAESAVGRLFVVSSANGIARVDLAAGEDPAAYAASYHRATGHRLLAGADVPTGLTAALRSGDGTRLAYDLGRCSAFETDVLMAALEIPPGEIRPYWWIAGRIGRPRAVRAVGSALGRNPVPVLIPCHRVVRSDGVLGNYALGPSLKRDLLAHEDVDLAGLEVLRRARVRFVASSATRAYCMPTCHRIGAVDEHERVLLAGATAAAEGGFRPCPDCRPDAMERQGNRLSAARGD